MEIGPIMGIRAVPSVKLPKNDPQLSAVFDIENTIGPQQDTFSKNEGKLTGGQDEATEDQDSPEREMQTTDSGSTVNLFA